MNSGKQETAKKAVVPIARTEKLPSAAFKSPAISALERLGFNPKHLDERFCFELKGQKDDKGEELKNLRVFWVRVKDKRGNAIEGKLFLPKEGKPKELAAYFPGFQGDGVVLFDDRHAPKISEQGTAVFVARHVTTRVDGPSQYVHCPERQAYEELSAELGSPEDLLSGTLGFHEQKQFFEKWAREPRIVLESIGGSFDSVHLIGHSWGGFNIAYSLMELESEKSLATNNVKTFISLSGRTGSMRDGGLWDNAGNITTEKMERIVSGVMGGGAHAGTSRGMFREFEETDGSLYENLKKGTFPKNLRMLFLMPKGDEYLTFSHGMDFLSSEAARREDSVGLAYEPKQEEKPGGGLYERHDFADLKTEELTEFMHGEGGHSGLITWFKAREP